MKAGLRSALFASLILVSSLITINPLALHAEGAVQAAVIANVNVRRGPGAGYAIVTSLVTGTTITIEARNSASNWLLVTTAKGKRGWLMARQVQLPRDFVVANLPISTEIIGVVEPAPAVNPGELPSTV